MKESTKYKMRFQKTNRQVVQLYITGRVCAMFYSVSEAARVTKISRTAITNALRKESGLQVSGGYVWKYADDYRATMKVCRTAPPADT